MKPYENLRKEMKKKGISANKLSLMAMISPANFSQALNGRMPMFPAWRKRISDVLDVSQEELFPKESEVK